MGPRVSYARKHAMSSPQPTTSNNTPGAPIKPGEGVQVENLNDPRELFPPKKRTFGECWAAEDETLHVTESRTPPASPTRTPGAPPPKLARRAANTGSEP